ncbi:biotin-dependent carboxyltransferase family protein [Devosia honganensis]|uniref:Biotin-dependent carboxyltransferase family protein n=1 Tax=Devosia honganensis TaxID=1610527 RepID=A0ABV7X3Z3_9HYPH
MGARLLIVRAAPLTTVQDAGRPGMLVHGVAASGPMDRAAHARAGLLAGATDGAGLEFTRAGLDLRIGHGQARLGWDGGRFSARIDGKPVAWPGGATLAAGATLSIEPGEAGNYGYLRFGGALDLPAVLGSRSTSTRARLGGVDGRPLRAGDELVLRGEGVEPRIPPAPPMEDGPIRFVWGIHADRFAPSVRAAFLRGLFRVTPTMDRMGVRLADEAAVFAGASILSLVSEPVLPGDIQVLGDGTPIVLMRDHQPTGGYPRIGTVISADLDRFAQLRAGSAVAFAPVSVDHAHRLLRSRPR